MDLSVAWASRDLSERLALEELRLDWYQPLCERCSGPPLQPRKVTALHQHSRPAALNAFCSCSE